MNWQNIKIIIGREYSVRVKKKSFILTTVLTPLLIVLLIAVPSLIMLTGDGDQKSVLVVDNTGIAAPYFENNSATAYTFDTSGKSIEELKADFSETEYYAIVWISAIDENGDASIITYSKEPLGIDLKSEIKHNVEDAIEDSKLSGYNIENLESIMEDIKTDVKVNSLTLKDDGQEKEDSVELYMALAYIMSFLIYIFVFMFGGMVMRGVIDEKSNRIVEVLVSSVNSIDLMMGKIIGIAMVALTQFAIWVGLTVALLGGVNTLAGQKMVSQIPDAQTIAETPGVNVDEDLVAVTQALQEENVLGGVMESIKELNIPYIVGCFIIYFLLGYLMYAAMFAAVGAAVDNEADTQQLSLPITIPLILGLFIMLHTFQHPSSQLSFWASIIPFTSPMVMLARIPFGVVPAWQLILSIVLLIVTFVLITILSSKIYRIGILTYGKKATFKDLLKWLKSKN